MGDDIGDSNRDVRSLDHSSTNEPQLPTVDVPLTYIVELYGGFAN